MDCPCQPPPPRIVRPVGWLGAVYTWSCTHGREFAWVEREGWLELASHNEFLLDLDPAERGAA